MKNMPPGTWAGTMWPLSQVKKKHPAATGKHSTATTILDGLGIFRSSPTSFHLNSSHLLGNECSSNSYEEYSYSCVDDTLVVVVPVNVFGYDTAKKTRPKIARNIEVIITPNPFSSTSYIRARPIQPPASSWPFYSAPHSGRFGCPHPFSFSSLGAAVYVGLGWTTF